MARDKITILDIARKKESGEKIVMITAYDAVFSRIFDEVGVDILLVGDSLGQVVLGLPDTLGVTMEDMARHTAAAARGRKRALLVADMPFLSFQTGAEEAIRNAGRLLQAGAEAVKLEGGRSIEATLRAITNCDIPVMGHVGLTPQSIHRMGGYRVQGKEAAQRQRLMDDALAVQEAGAFSLVLEGMPADLAAEINSTVENIGARRLHTVLEKLLEEISFTAPDLTAQEITITDAYVRERLAALIDDEDLSRYIL